MALGARCALAAHPHYAENGKLYVYGELRGKVLRLDVDGATLAPSDNPFVSKLFALRPEGAPPT